MTMHSMLHFSHVFWVTHVGQRHMIFWGCNGTTPCLLDFALWWIIRVEREMEYYRGVIFFVVFVGPEYCLARDIAL